MKNIIKENKDVKEIAKVISNTMERDLTKVQEVLDLDLNELIQIIDKLDKSKRDQVCSIMINNELEKLKSLTIEQFKEVSRDADEITDYYASKKEEFDAVIEEGDTVANDILFKVIGKNGRKLSLPIDISIIKEYCFSTELKEEQFSMGKLECAIGFDFGDGKDYFIIDSKMMKFLVENYERDV